MRKPEIHVCTDNSRYCSAKPEWAILQDGIASVMRKRLRQRYLPNKEV